MRDFLPPSQPSFIAMAHKSERDRKVGDRIKAVLAADKGRGIALISDCFWPTRKPSAGASKTTSTTTSLGADPEAPRASQMRPRPSSSPASRRSMRR